MKELTNFQKKFKQEAEITLENKELQQEILAIRKLWGIPKNGFDSSKDFDKTLEWIAEAKKDNYKFIATTLKQYPLLKTAPKYFLDLVLSYEDDATDYPQELYFLGEEDSFHNFINEKPFPGIVHYLLWNIIFIPESNELQMTSDKHGYTILRLGPNATMRDITDVYPIIYNLIQKNSPQYTTNKTRLKKNHERDKKIRQLGQEDRYDAVDILRGETSDNPSKEDDKKHLGNIRQIKSRAKRRKK